MFKKIITQLVNRCFPSKDETSSLEAFHSVENHLRGMRHTPHPEFERALLHKLRAHHETLQEKRMAHWLYRFRMPRWATASMVIVLLVSGTTLVGASPAPKPTPKPYGGFEATELPDFAPITFTFDQPMVQSSVEEAFAIEPAVEGHFIWNGREEMLFVPKVPLDPAVEYTITLSAEAKSLLQKNLEDPVVYQLTPQHVETPEEDPRAVLMEELRQIKDRPLTPEEKKFLQHELSRLEQSDRLKEWREARRQEFLESLPPKGTRDTETVDMMENGIKPSILQENLFLNQAQSDSDQDEEDGIPVPPLSDWSQRSTSTPNPL